MKKAGWFVFALVFLAHCTVGQEQDPAARIGAEISRLEAVIAGKSSTDPTWKDYKPMVERALGRSRRALEAGRLYLSLDELGSARGLLRNLEVVQDKAAALAEGLPGFEREWQSASRELAAVDREARSRTWDKTPAAIRALAEVAQGQTMILVDASRAYAKATTPKSGMYSLGEARAAAEFAAFCHSLRGAGTAAPLPLRSVRPELLRLQEQVNAAFKPPRSIDLHSKFIALNATLKLAGELDAAGLHAGALYQYLEAVQHFALLDAAAPDEAGQARVRRALAAFEAATGTSRRDDSIARLFLERAQATLAGGGGAPPSPDDWTTVAVIADQVLPAYQAALRAAPAPEKLAAGAVTVTLVRWPYT